MYAKDYNIVIPVEGVVVEPMVARAVDAMSRNASGVRGAVMRGAYRLGLPCPYDNGRQAIEASLRFSAYKAMVVDDLYQADIDALRDLVAEYNVWLTMDSPYEYVAPVFERLSSVVGGRFDMIATGRGAGARRALKQIADKNPCRTVVITNNPRDVAHIARVNASPILVGNHSGVTIVAGRGVRSYTSLAEFAREHTVRGAGR